MEFAYVAYNKDRKLVKGKISATNDGAATSMLASSGYQILSLKASKSILDMDKWNISFSRVNPKELIMFSRQLALLLSSGTDIVVALELLQTQTSDKVFRKALMEVVNDIRSGNSLATAMRKHGKVFPTIYWRTIAAGEKSGSLEVVLRQMADYLERRMVTEKKIRGAMTYPIVVLVVAVIVIAVLIVFVLPTFAELYSSFGTELPAATRAMIAIVDFLLQYGLALILGIVAIATGVYLYSRTKKGKYQIDSIAIRLPVIGRIIRLSELSRTCRTMALLFKVGLPLPEIMALVVQGSGNQVAVEALTGVQQALIRGEGLSKPMAKRSFFLPLMVQMVAVGEETGNLDTTLNTVAETYEVETDDRTQAAIGMIQPIMTIGIGLVIGFIAISMVSAMYSIYGTIGA
jgi:type IV pilus assembly protein PilC